MTQASIKYWANADCNLNEYLSFSRSMTEDLRVKLELRESYHSILSGMYEWAWQVILKHNLISHRGYFTHHDQRYQIKPLQSTDEGEHAILPISQGEPDTVNYKHGEKHAARKRSHLRISRSLTSSNVSMAFLQPMYFDCLRKDIRYTDIFRNDWYMQSLYLLLF